MKTKWCEGDIFAALAKRFADPAYVLLPQVRNATGVWRRIRTADAIAISVWPSRGLFLVGIEIKTTTSDWKCELANPEKSVEIQKYCRHWYVAAPKGIIDVSTIPPNWGLLECDGRGTHATKNAPVLEVQPVDMGLLCSILRNMARATVPKSQVKRATAAEVEALVESRTSSIEFAAKRLRDKVKAFERASGINITHQWDAGRIGRAVKIVMDSGIDSYQSRLQYLHKQAKQITASIGNELEKTKTTNEEDNKLE